MTQTFLKKNKLEYLNTYLKTNYRATVSLTWLCGVGRWIDHGTKNRRTCVGEKEWKSAWNDEGESSLAIIHAEGQTRIRHLQSQQGIQEHFRGRLLSSQEHPDLLHHLWLGHLTAKQAWPQESTEPLVNSCFSQALLHSTPHLEITPASRRPCSDFFRWEPHLTNDTCFLSVVKCDAYWLLWRALPHCKSVNLIFVRLQVTPGGLWLAKLK